MAYIYQFIITINPVEYLVIMNLLTEKEKKSVVIVSVCLLCLFDMFTIVTK
jgi:hypothetical protein